MFRSDPFAPIGFDGSLIAGFDSLAELKGGYTPDDSYRSSIPNPPNDDPFTDLINALAALKAHFMLSAAGGLNTTPPIERDDPWANGGMSGPEMPYSGNSGPWINHPMLAVSLEGEGNPNLDPSVIRGDATRSDTGYHFYSARPDRTVVIDGNTYDVYKDPDGKEWIRQQGDSWHDSNTNEDVVIVHPLKPYVPASTESVSVAPPVLSTTRSPDNGYVIEPPPPIAGYRSDALYFRPGFAQIAETGRQERQKAQPDLHTAYSGLIAEPLGLLEEYLVRPILNIPHSVVGKVTTAGQHFDRGSQWIQQDEWAEASSDAFQGVADLAEAFLVVAATFEGLGSKGAPARSPRPSPQTSLAPAIETSLPAETSSLPRLSDRAIAQQHLFNVNAANILNEVPYLRDAWRRDLGSLNQEGLVRSLENNPATKDLYLGIDQRPGQSVPDLLHTGRGTAKPFGEVTSLNPVTVAEHRGRWYWEYSDPLLYPNAPSGWNIWQSPGGRRLRIWQE